MIPRLNHVLPCAIVLLLAPVAPLRSLSARAPAGDQAPRIQASPTTILTLETGDGPDSIATADFNLDSRLDLAVANRDSNSVSVFLGRGDGTFDEARVFETAPGPRSVRAVDLNHDGRPDLVTANVVDTGVSIMLGDGHGTFQPRVDIPIRNACDQCSRPATDVVADDLDGDGHVDLAVAALGSNVITVVLGRGDGTFGDQIDGAGFVRDDPVALALGDFDRDGRLDLATANHDAVSVSTLSGHGNGSFASGMEVSTQSFSSSIAVSDLNRDGFIDLVVANYFVRFRPDLEFGRDSVSVLLGDGAGRFAVRSDTTAGAGPTAVTTADFDGDGHVDAGVANAGGNNVSLFFGRGDGTFGRRLDIGTGAGPSAIVNGDFDGDGRVDVAVANAAANTVSVILNNWAPGHVAKTVRPPVADAYVRSGAWASRNFGGSSNLYVSKGLSPDNTRRGYLTFDVQDVTTFTRATVRLYGGTSTASTPPIRTTVYAVGDTTWNENTVTWNTRPDLGALLGALTVNGGAPAWLEIDVTTFLRAERAAGHGHVSLALRSVDHTSAFAIFTARDAGSRMPQLVITP
jgi:hypothetical protein